MSGLNLVFLSPGALGHANVHLALCRYFLSSQQDGISHTTIHIVADQTSLPLFKSVVASTEGCTIKFHAMADDNFLAGVSLKSPPPRASRPASLRIYDLLANLWFRSPAAHLKRYQKLREILDDIKPDLVVVDMLYSALGADACRQSGYQYVLLSPGPTLDTSNIAQPQGRGFWYYPALLSSTPFPVPWYSIPWNVVCVLAQLFAYTHSSARRMLDATRHAAGITGTIYPPVSDGAKAMLHASLPDLEYPHIPLKGSVYCGAIVTRQPKISTLTYPAMSDFLDRERTILINLGSIFKYTVDDVVAVAEAITSAYNRFSKSGGFQVLWKLPGAASYRATLDKHLKNVDTDKILIQEWIAPASLAVLQHHNIVASVHHGGANSLIESAFAGVPQIILPMWLDLYTLAVRVETLGHGIQANRGFESSINGPLLADAIAQILDCDPGTKGYRIREKARELAVTVQKTQGDKLAAEVIVKVAKGQLEEVPYASTGYGLT